MEAFDSINEKVGAALIDQGFAKSGTELHEPNGKAVMYVSDGLAYSLFFNNKSKCFELRSTTLSGENTPGEWKTLSRWLFDPANDGANEATSIANDFVTTIEGPKRVEALQQERKKRNKDEDRTIDPQFFFNRLVGVFPDLKEEMAKEKIIYGEVRSFTFARDVVAVKIEALAREYPDSEPCKKMCTLLSDMYDNGDMDTRSIVTTVILNAIPDETYSALTENFSDALKAAGKCARKFRGKKVKPEKKKKPSRLKQVMLDKQ